MSKLYSSIPMAVLWAPHGDPYIAIMDAGSLDEARQILAADESEEEVVDFEVIDEQSDGANDMFDIVNSISFNDHGRVMLEVLLQQAFELGVKHGRKYPEI